MKKFLVVLLSVLSTVIIATALTGCSNSGHVHTFDKQVVSGEYLAKEATCTEKATYYYSCECGAKGTNTFEIGAPLGHSFTNYVSDNNATCTKDGTKTAKCDRCDETDTVIEENTKLEHSYTEQVVNQIYLASSATCIKKATYYYSCKCGAAGTETFEYGSTTNHNYVNGVCTYCGKEQQTSQGLEFTLLDDGTYEVSGMGSCTDMEIVIPSVHNDKPVTVIGSEAFKKCKQLKSVIIPESVTIIKGAAFASCTGLTSVTIPNSIISIGENAFYNCCYIEIALPENVVTIGDYAFSFCEMINTEIVIPKSVVSIGVGAFSGCTKVEKITVDKDNLVYYSSGNCIIEKSSKTLISGCKTSIIPNDVIAIADSAFSACFRLINITIPDSITTIGGAAFWFCKNLTSVVIGGGVKSIEDYAFSDCYKIVEIINNSNLEITRGSDKNGYIGYYALNVKNGGTTDIVNKDGYLFYAYEKVNYLIGYADTSLNDMNLTLPESYNGGNYEIYQFAFTGYITLTDVVIPNCVTRIGECAFESCVKLTSVSIPDSVANVNSTTFMFCDNIQYNESGNLLYLGNSDNPYAFLLIPQNIDITSCIINKNTKSIESGVFAECTGLTRIIVEKDNPIYYSENNCVIEKSSKRLIAGCQNSIIPNDVKIIEDYAFNNCSGLESIIIPDSVTRIGDCAFCGCIGLTNVVIGNGVINIGKQAFDGCTGLTSIIIPDSVTSIGERAFDDCTGLINVVIGNGVTSIGRGVFSGCSELINVTIGNSVENIESYAFQECRKITNINISSIESWCKISGLSNLILSHGYHNNPFKLYLDGKEITELIIPKGVTSIGDYAFYNSGITRVTIPDSVTSIGGCAFAGCNVTNINISSIESWCKIRGLVCLMGLGEYDPVNNPNKLYLNGKEITELIIPYGVTSIGDYAFYNCSGLTTIIIPSSITSIGNNTFDYCSELKNITYKGTIAEWKNIAKGNRWYYDSSCVIHCTDGDINIE